MKLKYFFYAGSIGSTRAFSSTNFTAINSKTITDWGNLLEYNLQNLPQSIQSKRKKNTLKFNAKHSVYLPNIKLFGKLVPLFSLLALKKYLIFFNYWLINKVQKKSIKTDWKIKFKFWNLELVLEIIEIKERHTILSS